MKHFILVIAALFMIACPGEEETSGIATHNARTGASTDPIVVFWQWFQENTDRFDRFEEEQSLLMDELAHRLQAIDSNLVYEISSENSGTRELVISADGIRDSFPLVQEFTSKAPEIAGWKITAFRQRTDQTLTLEFNGQSFEAEDFYFHLRNEGKDIDLILYVPNLTQKNRDFFVSACYILLDMALGEYDVTTKIRYIDHHPRPSNPEKQGLSPLTDLPRQFDELFAKTQIPDGHRSQSGE